MLEVSKETNPKTNDGQRNICPLLLVNGIDIRNQIPYGMAHEKMVICNLGELLYRLRNVGRIDLRIVLQ
jgi:hypothetical protein